MKKYLIHFMSVDIPSIDDDGISTGTGLGICPQAFNSKEDAQKYLEKALIPEYQADLEDCYGITDDPKLADSYEFLVEDGNYERKELNVYDKLEGYLISSTIYEVVEVEF